MLECHSINIVYFVIHSNFTRFFLVPVLENIVSIFTSFIHCVFTHFRGVPAQKRRLSFIFHASRYYNFFGYR